MTDPNFPQPPVPQAPQQGAPQYAAYPQQSQQQYAQPSHPTIQQPVGGGQYPPISQDPRQNIKGTSGMAITSLVLGTIGIVLSWIPIVNNFAAVLGILGLIFGIIAIIKTGSKGKKKGRGLAIAGTVLSVLTMVITLGTQSFYGKTLDEASKALSSASASLESTNKDTSKPKKSDDTTKPTTSAGIPDLTGTWTEAENSNKSMVMNATITSDKITINWTSADTTALYWQGSFTAPTTDGDYAWTSTGDTTAMSASLLGSQDTTKEFKYTGGQLTFDVTTMGVTVHVKLVKQ